MQQFAARGVHGQTVEVLAQRILTGQLPEGHTLDLIALQSEFDVSLTVLREALRVLAAKGMVDARPKRGTFVRPRAAWSLLDPDVLRWQFARSQRPGPSSPLYVKQASRQNSSAGSAAGAAPSRVSQLCSATVST